VSDTIWNLMSSPALLPILLRSSTLTISLSRAVKNVTFGIG